MGKAARISIVLITLSSCLTLQRQLLAQSRETHVPNSPPVVQLIATTNPIFIEDVRFEGLSKVRESDVRKAFREQRIGFTKNALFVFVDIQKGAKVITQMLASNCYMNAAVDVRIEDVSARSKHITFVVNEGQSSVISEIQFDGNRVFSDDELRAQLELVTESGDDDFDPVKLEYDLNHVRNFMRSRGYLQARTAEPKYQSVDGGVRITVPVEEGRLFRIGEMTILGSERFSPEQIVELIGLNKGDIADGRRISDALFDELKSLYGNMGYPQYSAEPDPEYRDNPNVEDEGILDVQITIEEGACFTIGLVEFLGNKKLTAQELQRFLLFKEGDIYNQQLIQDSVRGLNESGSVEPILLEKDVDFQSDEETGLIGVIIKVQEY